MTNANSGDTKTTVAQTLIETSALRDQLTAIREKLVFLRGSL